MIVLTGLGSAAEWLGVTYLTVHAQDEAALVAAVASAPGVGILGVTVLTSVRAEELARQTGGREVIDVVVERAKLARDVGCKGVVCSLTFIRLPAYDGPTPSPGDHFAPLAGGPYRSAPPCPICGALPTLRTCR